ncbi:Hypothetical protein A7982_06413 [Minicystis rosea]|nr:Hypothetical protein A7982_06413 [Minicystis rosea]
MEELCSTLENIDEGNAAAQLRVLHTLLPRLYAAALCLPKTSVLFADDDGPDAAHAPAAEPSTRTALPPGLSALAAFLGLQRCYREIFDPYASYDEEAGVGDLIDDLGDIFIDLDTGRTHWRAGNTGEALWEWRFSFEAHWGTHATSAMRALHTRCAWYDGDWPHGAG